VSTSFKKFEAIVREQRIRNFLVDQQFVPSHHISRHLDSSLSRAFESRQWHRFPMKILPCSRTYVALSHFIVAVEIIQQVRRKIRLRSVKSSSWSTRMILEVNSLLGTAPIDLARYAPITFEKLKYTIVTEGALHLSAEYLRLFVIESLHRSVEIAKQEQSDLDMVRLGGPDKTNGEVQLKVSMISTRQVRLIRSNRLIMKIV
jgi:hypothetical protein